MSTTTATVAPEPETITETHPVRGALWGLMMGVGLSLVLVITKVIYLDLIVMAIVVGASIVIGVLWGSLGPPKPPSGPAPVAVDTSPSTRSGAAAPPPGGATASDPADDIAPPDPSAWDAPTTAETPDTDDSAAADGDER